MSPRYRIVFLVLTLIGMPSVARGAVTGLDRRRRPRLRRQRRARRDEPCRARRGAEGAGGRVHRRDLAHVPDRPVVQGSHGAWRAGHPDRAIAGAAARRGTLPLGDAMLDRHTGTGVLATIYVDRVEWLARQAGADSRALLGRAIAHELGHLLLATTSARPGRPHARALVAGRSAPRPRARLGVRADRTLRDASSRRGPSARHQPDLGHEIGSGL